MKQILLYHLLAFVLILSGCQQNPGASPKPNIILFLVDDLGYGDLGCYGNRVNITPNIDQLAKEGMKFTDFHSNGPMCTPTRASLLTGMYQNRFGEMFEGPLSGKTQYDEGLPLEARTIAEALKDAGYTTGMFGKWHLGYKPPFLPVSQGFDEFIGLAAGDGDHHSHIDRWGREDWWKNDALAMETGYSVDLITKHSVDFIQNNQDNPFFLYIPHLAIHFPWQGPEDHAQREKGVAYENDKWGIIPDRSNVQPHVKAMVEKVDWSLGKIISILQKLNLDENTLVIFTSDNGGYIHYNHKFLNISSNGKLRGQKAEVYEGGHRVPFIARWPGKINAGSNSGETALTMDLFPTITKLTGIQNSGTQPIDGVDLSEILFGDEKLPERTLFWKMGDELAIRQGPWKFIKIADQQPELYNLDDDLSETNNLASSHKELVKELWEDYSLWLKQMESYSRKFSH